MTSRITPARVTAGATCFRVKNGGQGERPAMSGLPAVVVKQKQQFGSGPRADPRTRLIASLGRASFRNACFLPLGHMPDHDVVMRHVHSGVTRVEVEADVVYRSSESRRLQ